MQSFNLFRKEKDIYDASLHFIRLSVFNCITEQSQSQTIFNKQFEFAATYFLHVEHRYFEDDHSYVTYISGTLYRV